MNIFDWVLIVLFVIGAVWGLRKGLIDAALLAASIYVALLLGAQFAARLLTPIWDNAENQALGVAAGYVIIFIAVFIAGRFVSHLVKSNLRRFKLGWTNQAGGVLVGVLVGLLMAGGLMAVTARFTYVIEEEAVGSGGEDSEQLIDRLRESAEGYLVDFGRDNSDGWLTGSEVVGILLDIRDFIPGNALGLAPDDFNLALDILQDRRDEA